MTIDFDDDWISFKRLAEVKDGAIAEAREDWRMMRMPKWTRATWRQAADPTFARHYATAYQKEARGISTDSMRAGRRGRG